MKIEPTRFSGSLYFISVAGCLCLIAMGILFIFDNIDAAKLFGVPIQDEPSGAYVTVAAVRDISVGILALAFTLLRDRRAMGLTVLLSAIIPIGDGIVVLVHSPTPLKFLPLHWGGAIGCLIFALLLLRRA
jgi:hypothetical protein